MKLHELMTPTEMMAFHADYVANGARNCTCGQWEDESRSAQSTRIPFIEHVVTELASAGYHIVGTEAITPKPSPPA